MLPTLEIIIVVWHSSIVTDLLSLIEIFKIWFLLRVVDTVPYVCKWVSVANKGALPILILVTWLGSQPIILVEKIILII